MTLSMSSESDSASIPPGTIAAGFHKPLGPRLLRSAGRRGVPLALTGIALVLVVLEGPHDVVQVTVFGVVSGTYFALGAIGLTLLTSLLKVINFAHGDFLTFGAYMTLAAMTAGNMPFAAAVLVGVAATGVLGMGLEAVLWRPMRARHVTTLPMMLMSIGLAFVIRESIHLFVGAEQRRVDVDIYSSVELFGIRVGRLNLVLVLVGILVLSAIGLGLRYTSLGKRVRAVADDSDLAEATGINTARILLCTWVLAGALAGLGGAFYAASIGFVTPTSGQDLLLGLFAAMVLGGVGNAYGALAGGLIIGLTQEWSTLLIEPRWKIGVGFVVLIGALLFRPNGLFGHRTTP